MLAHNKTAPFLLVVSNFWGAVQNGGRFFDFNGIITTYQEIVNFLFGVSSTRNGLGETWL
jgi:hypothetical protein